MPRLRERDVRPFGDRAAPLIEEAAERSRVSMRTRLERLRVSWRSILQVGVAAGLAWVIATELFGHPRPFFAPVSAIIILGLTTAERGRRAVEVALGVALGIAVGDLLVLEIGVGAAQLSVVVMLATALAIFLGSGQMLAGQAAVSAALVATLQPPTDGVTFARFLDALAGGAVALIVNAFVLPADPLAMIRRAARPVLDELAATLDDIAVAIVERDRALADAALVRAREIDEPTERFAESVNVARETTVYAPLRRRSR
ncbi:MAG TPA: FUSC family protein, partial [Solirubrobacteraceae bacterium]|nr:FUSC family protein [Solirubrobacteraceae bacterium]